MPRFALLTIAGLACLVLPTTAQAAGAIVPPNGGPTPMYVHMRTAVAATTNGSTRWSQVTVPAQSRALWLVPVRPGGAVDWASDRWLDALDRATAPQVLPPTEPTSCEMPTSIDEIAPWTPTVASKTQASAPIVQTTATEASNWASAHGYTFSAELSARLSGLYESGWLVVALELGSASSTSTSGTLRVSDDGGPVLPLTITGGASTRLTVFAIGGGVASVSGTVDVDARQLRWGVAKSNYATWRSDLLETGEGNTWLRESSSHDAIFSGTSLPNALGLPSVVANYFDDASCKDAAGSAGSNAGIVGTSCAPGAAARAPGGTACVPSAGDVNPRYLSCSDQIDLALALSGQVSQNAVVTRWSAASPAGVLKTNLSIALKTTVPERSPILRAGSYDLCMDLPETPRATAPPMRTPSGSMSTAPAESDPIYISDGCGGTIVATGGGSDTEEEPEPESSSSSDSCSSDDSSGWDSSDDSSGWDDSEGCSSGDSSSSDSSSDSCSSDSSSSDSSDSDDSDGWDTEDEMSPSGKKIKPAGKKIKPAAKKPHAAKTKKTRSTVSRFALLGVAILLPLRRRRRPTSGEETQAT